MAGPFVATDMRVVAFDFDGTLSDSEMIVRLAERAGVAGEVADITERAMNDEIGYARSLRERARLLDGLPEAEAARAFDGVDLRPGAGVLLRDLRGAGLKTAVLTGGFAGGVRAALDRADTGVDCVVANRLPFDDGALTGEVEGPLVEGTKDGSLRALCATFDCDLSETVAVGDGANDLPMLEVAGLAVGYDPKPAVEPACDVVVSDVDELRTVFTERGLLSVE
jgi:phosphoserine phosphatase